MNRSSSENKPDNTKATLLRERAEHGRRIAEIDAQLADLEATPPDAPDVFGSRPPLAPLPGKSYRRTRELAPKIPGSVREGGLRGRDVTWRIPRAAYDAWLAAQSRPATRCTGLSSDVDKWITNAGIRLTRRAS